MPETGFRSTVIIPVFNTGAVLRETVESVLSQSDGKDEIIIIDDASTDIVTINTIEEFRSNPIVKIVRHERNRGLGVARNTGVKNASSEIIVPLDSDDILAEGYFEKMIPPFSDPEVAFTYCDVQCFGKSDELWKSSPFNAERIIESQYIRACSPFRKSIHAAVGGYCEEDIFRYNEDWDFWLSVCEKGFKGVYVPSGLFLYRRYVPSGLYLYRRSNTNMTSVPRTFSPAVQQRMLERHRDFITRHMSAQEFLAHGFSEAGYGYLLLNRPIRAIRYVGKLLTTPGWRKNGILLFLFAVKKALNLLITNNRGNNGIEK